MGGDHDLIAVPEKPIGITRGVPSIPSRRVGRAWRCAGSPRRASARPAVGRHLPGSLRSSLSVISAWVLLEIKLGAGLYLIAGTDWTIGRSDDLCAGRRGGAYRAATGSGRRCRRVFGTSDLIPPDASQPTSRADPRRRRAGSRRGWARRRRGSRGPGPGLVAPPRPGRDADDVPLLDSDDLVVELHAPAPPRTTTHTPPLARDACGRTESGSRRNPLIAQTRLLEPERPARGARNSRSGSPSKLEPRSSRSSLRFVTVNGTASDASVRPSAPAGPTSMRQTIPPPDLRRSSTTHKGPTTFQMSN